MAIPLIPVKTPDGQAELAKRERRLSQRHRTVLFLVDGRRDEAQVRAMAQQAGATESCFAELLELGMIAMQPRDGTIPVTVPAPLDDEPLHVDIPIEPPPPAPLAPPAGDDEPESLLPAARTLSPESSLGDAMSESALQAFEALEAGRTDDSALEEAREILLRAVRAEAPLAGSLTMMRLRRARTRDDLAGLIDEVEARIIKPYRSLAAQQTLRRARHLLTARADPLQPVT